ncbi:hypothetical protein EDC01DRAFT_139003 [Geopyxis carbonaria]|nr:hypothetical protein EDC01DRAFT_139003 [Geopyxis carbonaria]
MHENGDIEGRISGKQVVYHACQDPKNNVTEEELKSMDEEAEELRKETAGLKIKLKEFQSSLSSLRSTPNAASLSESIEKIEEENEKLEAKLTILRKSSTKKIDPEKKALMEAEHVRVEKLYNKRKKQFKTFWNIICDGYPGDREALWEDLGLDGDIL